MNKKLIIIFVVISIVSIIIFYSYTNQYPSCVLEIIDIVDSNKKIISEQGNGTSGLFSMMFDDPVKQKEYEKLTSNCLKQLDH